MTVSPKVSIQVKQSRAILATVTAPVDKVVGRVLALNGNDNVATIEAMTMMDKLRQGLKYSYDDKIRGDRVRVIVSPLHDHIKNY